MASGMNNISDDGGKYEFHQFWKKNLIVLRIEYLATVCSPNNGQETVIFISNQEVH